MNLITVFNTDLSETDARILRYAFGATLAVALAVAFNWPVAFLAPLLTIVLLASPAPRPTLRMALGFILNIVVAAYIVLLTSRMLQPYPLVHTLIIGLMLLWAYYAKGGNTPPLFILWLLITLCALPLLMMRSQALAHTVGFSVVFSGAVALLVVWFSFAIFPDRVNQTKHNSTAIKRPVQIPTKEERFTSAVNSTIVVFPVVIFFHTYQLAGDLVILIFVALLSMQPDFARDFKGSKIFVIGNIGGGIAAIIFYELMVIVPQFAFLIALTLLAGMIFGAGLFSGKPTAALYGKAFTGMLLVTIAATSSTGEADEKVYIRVLQITLAVTYIVVAFGLVEHFRKVRFRKVVKS